MIIAVTGATGFVGRSTCELLVAEGHEVIALTRGPARGPWARSAIIGDLAEERAEPTLTRTLAGVDAVVHLAARVHVMHETEPDPHAAFRAANVDGTRRVLAAAVRSGVRRFILMSTVKVLGEEREAAYVEEDPPAGADPYSRSKAEAEALVRGSSSRIEGVIIRPPLVYGPGVGGNFARLLRLADMSRRIPLPFASVRNRRSMVSVRNLASAVHRCVQHSAAAGETFLVADAEAASTPELLELAASSLGGHARLFGVPPRLLGLAGALAGKGKEAQRLLTSLTVTTARIQQRTGWSPVQSLADGIREAAESYAREHRVHV